MKKGKSRSSKTKKWEFIPLRYLVLILSVVGIFILISDGYEFFVNMGWNVGPIIVLRKASYFFLMIVAALLIYFLLKFFLGVAKDWRKGSYYSDVPRWIEKGFVSLFLVGPSIFFLISIVFLIFTLITVDDSHWHGHWDFYLSRR